MYSHFFIDPKLWLFSCNELYTPGVKKEQGTQKDTTTVMMLDFLYSWGSLYMTVNTTPVIVSLLSAFILVLQVQCWRDDGVC